MDQQNKTLWRSAFSMKCLLSAAFLAISAMSNSLFAQAGGPGASDFTGLPLSFHLNGEYYFYTMANINGHPVCSERWIVNDDETMTVFSGQEIVRKRFHIEKDGHLSEGILISQVISTNGQPDCMEKVSKVEESRETRTMFYLAKSGNFVFFNQQFSPAGMRLIAPYAWLYPSETVKNSGTAP